MAVDLNNVRVLIYTCRGWNVGSTFPDSKFLSNYDICLIQEHWLLNDEQLHLLNSIQIFVPLG